MPTERSSALPTTRPVTRLAPWLLIPFAFLIAWFAGPIDLDPEFGNATVQYHQALGKGYSRAQGDGLPPKAPNPYFFAERAYPLGKIPLDRWRSAQIEAASLRESNLRGGNDWVFRGPTNIGGRITDIAVHPTDASIVYAGAASGGVIKSTDSGQTWVPMFDDQPNMSIGAIALDPSDPEVVYAGTGETNPGGGSVAYGGQGIFRSTDGGATWTSLGLENTGSIGRIRVDPTDPDRIFVAALGLLWDTSTDRGVYRTTNGGSSWERVLYVDDDAGAVDLIQRPDEPDVLYAAIWQRLRQPEVYDYGGSSCGVHRTTDGGDTWSLVGGGLPGTSSNRGRIGLSLCAADPDVMHAVYADRVGYFDGLYRSEDGGFNWTRTNDGSLSDVFASYGWWFGNVRTHPVDPDRIFVIGFDFYRSTNGGSSYSNAGGSMHVDHHALDFGPGASPVMYEGNDGGLYRSTNGGSVWSFLPNQPITQFYRVALDAGNPNALLGGAQDNGTLRTTSGDVDDFHSLFGGDGFEPLVHPNNSQRIWVQYQYGNLYYSSNGGGSFNSATGGVSSGDRKNWNSPIAQDPTDADTRYWGTHRLYRSNGNTSWTTISPDLTGGSHQGNGGQVNGTLTVIGVSPADGDYIWTGSDDGYVQVTTNGGGSWSNVSAGLPDRWITGVRPDPSDVETAYVTVSGFRWSETMPHVYKTTNTGASWVSVSGNLPDAPANDLIVDFADTDRLFVATDVGVYQSTNGGDFWIPLGSSLPNVVVTDLAYEPVSRVLTAATYGRSFFSIEIDEPTNVPQQDPLLAGAVNAPYPNPTSDGAWLSWENRTEGHSVVEVLTVSGRRVWSHEVEDSQIGEHKVWWEGAALDGQELSAGTYYVRVLTNGLNLGGRPLVIRP